jgi:hypothetical protein
MTMFAWRRRRRLLYLMAVYEAPLGIRRPTNPIRDEIQALMDREFPFPPHKGDDNDDDGKDTD